MKQAFLKAQQDGWAQRETRKPVVADEIERDSNPRSRSAKFRVIRRLGGDNSDTAGGVRR